MSYDTTYNAQSAIELAKLQGTMAGVQAGNAYYNGTAAASTSIWNQAGYQVLQDSETGDIKVKQTYEDSLKTGIWYDQATDTVYDFSNLPENIKERKISEVAGTSGATSTSNDGTATTDTDEATGEGQTVTADQLKKLVEEGIYDNAYDALNDTLAKGYTVSDEDQAALGIYSTDDEEKIQTYMETYGVDRQSAIEELGDKVTPKTSSDEEVLSMYNSLIASGFSEDEAKEYLKALGYEVPENADALNLDNYSTEDQDKIIKLCLTTGCTTEEAIEMLGVTPSKTSSEESTESKGLIRSIGDGVCGFFKSIGNCISSAWNTFVDWIW